MAKKPFLRKHNFFIGTSGYNYPHWKGVFYPKGCAQNKWLEYYTQHFNSVELNVTFYRLLKKEVFIHWYQRTPPQFVFVVKGSRYITHIKRLNKCEDSLTMFFDRASGLKEKLRCVLWQLPPSMRCNHALLDDFLIPLASQYGQYLQCFEFRHPSWLSQTTYEILRRHEAGLCIPDSPHFPCAEIITGSFVYLRFHGGKILYGSEYSLKELKNWVDKAAFWIDNKKNLFAFFNNDAYGFAVKNALQFRELLHERI